MRRFYWLTVVFWVLLLGASACSKNSGGIYRTSVQQGNIITPKMVGQLEIGMTKPQVEFILGRTILRPFFEVNRWEYVYRLQPPQGAPVTRYLILHFDADKLASFETDVPTSQRAPVADPK